MEIQSLKLLLTDADLSQLIRQALRDEDRLENVQVRLLPEGVHLQGEFSTGFGFKVPFETIWQVKPAGSALEVELETIKVAGLSAGMLRGALLRTVGDYAEEHPGVSMDQETLRIDLREALSREGVDLLVRFTAVRMSIGAAVIEAAS